MVFQVQQYLEYRGIPCFIKNEYIAGAIGEVAPFDAEPEVWLIDDTWLPRAQALIEQYFAEEEAGNVRSEWQCRECNEVNEPNFDCCWKCQRERVD